MTGGLSYCLHIVAAISLHIGSSLTTAHYDSGNLTDLTDSRQFRQNMEISKLRDNPHWLENYKHKPLKHHKVKKRPFWESNVVPGQWKNDPKDKEVENWEGMMRKVTGERLKQWSTRGVKGKLNSGKNISDEGEISQGHKQQLESLELATEITKITDSKYTPTLLSENLEDSVRARKSMNNFPMKNEVLQETMSPYRWGMSKNQPPDDVLEKILKNDLHKSYKNTKISQENKANDDNDNNDDNDDYDYDAYDDNDDDGNDNNGDDDNNDDNNDDDDDDDDNDDKVDHGMVMRIASDVERYNSSERLKSLLNDVQIQPQENSHWIKIKNTTTQLPMSSSETTHPDPLDTANLSKNTYEKISHLQGADAIYNTGIKKSKERSQIFPPIFVLGPIIYVTDLPKIIKQKLRIHQPMKFQSRTQFEKIIEDNKIQSKGHKQGNGPGFTGIYQFY